MGEPQQCPAHRNGNGGLNGSVSISHRGASDKEASHPEYWTRDNRSGDGVLTGRIGNGISAADRGSSND